jgi:AcrR family transcriptional regulator
MALSEAQERRSQRRADARRAILDATEALLSEGGEESLSIRRVAERCGYTAPTIYHYFGDKQGLLDALLDECFRKVLRVIRRVPVAEDPLATLRGRARAFVRFALRHPAHYRILTGPRAPGAAPVPSAEEARDLLDQPWRELIQCRRLDPADQELAERSSFALLHGLITLRANRPEADWSDRQVEASVDALLRGWLRPAESPPRRARGSA